MSKVKIEICEGNNTNGQLMLSINDNRIAGIESGFGYKLITSWNVDKDNILNAINSTSKDAKTNSSFIQDCFKKVFPEYNEFQEGHRLLQLQKLLRKGSPK